MVKEKLLVLCQTHQLDYHWGRFLFGSSMGLISLSYQLGDTLGASQNPFSLCSRCCPGSLYRAPARWRVPGSHKPASPGHCSQGGDSALKATCCVGAPPSGSLPVTRIEAQGRAERTQRINGSGPGQGQHWKKILFYARFTPERRGGEGRGASHLQPTVSRGVST